MLDQRVEIGAAAEPRRELSEPRGGRGVVHECGARVFLGVDRRVLRSESFDAQHAVDVRGAQPEHVLHAGEGRDLVDVVAQPFEHLAASFSALEVEEQAVLVVRPGIDEQHAGPRILDQVAHRLGEELIRERDAFAVDHPDPGEVRDVRSAVGRGGCDHGRDHAFEAPVELTEIDLLGLDGVSVGVGHAP